MLFQKFRVIFQKCDCTADAEVFSSFQKSLFLLLLAGVFEIKDVIFQSLREISGCQIFFQGFQHLEHFFQYFFLKHDFSYRLSCTGEQKVHDTHSFIKGCVGNFPDHCFGIFALKDLRDLVILLVFLIQFVIFCKFL